MTKVYCPNGHGQSTDAQAAAKFCATCGSRLLTRCAQNHEVEVGSFCSVCGAMLQQTVPVSEPPERVVTDPVAEASPLPRRRAVIVSATLAVALAGVVGYFVGTEVAKRSALTGTEPSANIAEVPQQQLSGSVWMTATVDPTKPGWQDTSLQLRKNDQIVVVWVSGQWTVDSNNLKDFPLTGPDGYTAQEVDDKISKDCKVDPNQPHGALLARTSGAPYQDQIVNRAYRFFALADGILQLRINDIDSCLKKSKGSMVVFVGVAR